MEVILWIVLLGFAILVTALVVSLYYRHKYEPIFRQLSELLDEQKMAEAQKTTEQPAQNPDKTTKSPTRTTKEKSRKETIVIEDEDGDEKLFQKLTATIRHEQLYTVPKFGRNELMERFQLSSKRVSKAFSVAGTSVPEFIRECRLEHARQLIVSQPDLQLTDIATASGFVHTSTFTVDFKKKYGISPSQYREEKLKALSEVQRE